jgi:hypothetical protein
MPEAWQRPLPDAGIDGVELSLRPPQTAGMQSPCGAAREPARKHRFNFDARLQTAWALRLPAGMNRRASAYLLIGIFQPMLGSLQSAATFHRADLFQQCEHIEIVR